MASAINCDRNQKKSVKDEVAHVRINSMYRDANNWSPAHIYHEISGYTKLSDINRKGNLNHYIIILNIFMEFDEICKQIKKNQFSTIFSTLI